MGFGTLLIGYLITFLSSITDIYFFGDIIGGCIMLWGLYRLARYQKGYLHAVLAMFAFLAVSLVGAVMIVFSIDAVSVVDYIIRITKLLITAVIHRFFLTATAKLSREADAPELSRRAKRNLVVSYCYYGLSLFLNLTAMILEKSTIGAEIVYASYLIAFLGIVIVILNAWLIYQCFGMLCLEEDLEYTPKKSKFEFINKMSAKIDKLDVLYHPEPREEKPHRHKKKKK